VSQGLTHHNFHAVWKRVALGGTCSPPGDFSTAVLVWLCDIYNYAIFICMCNMLAHPICLCLAMIVYAVHGSKCYCRWIWWGLET